MHHINRHARLVFINRTHINISCLPPTPSNSSMQRGSAAVGAAGRERSQSRGRANARPAAAANAGNVKRSNLSRANRSSRRGSAKTGAAATRGRSAAATAGQRKCEMLYIGSR